MLETIELARTIANALEDKKAEDILLIDVQKQCSFADYFVICSGTSERQVEALVEAIIDAVRKRYKRHPRRIDGHAPAGWVAADFGSVIAHIFSIEQRKRYKLEELWREAKVVLHIQ